MKIALMAAISVLGMVQAADAQDGFYYGIGLGVTESSTNAPIVSDYTATATDLSLAHRWLTLRGLRKPPVRNRGQP